MATTQTQRLGIFLMLALVMATTRIHHFGALPDASWGIFFLAGFWLRGAARWAFPLLIAEAVLIDYLVITGQGIDFWSHYCISPAYWCMPAYFGALWMGGSWLARHARDLRLPTLGLALFALLVSEAVCFLISNGSFYWLSANVPQRSLGGWMTNMVDWYMPFLGITALYVGLGAALHIVAVLLTGTLRQSSQRRLHH
jgi:hypothetical protein